jgi:hypothetical protein
MDTISPNDMTKAIKRCQQMLRHLKETTAALEVWQNIAETNPQAFERLRGQYFTQLIGSALPRPRATLCALQQRLDAPRREDLSAETAYRRIEDEAVQLCGVVEQLRQRLKESEASSGGRRSGPAGSR